MLERRSGKNELKEIKSELKMKIWCFNFKNQN